MKYQIWLPDDTAVECTQEIFSLQRGDVIHLNQQQYIVESKSVDYDEKTCDVNVDFDE